MPLHGIPNEFVLPYHCLFKYLVVDHWVVQLQVIGICLIIPENNKTTIDAGSK